MTRAAPHEQENDRLRPALPGGGHSRRENVEQTKTEWGETAGAEDFATRQPDTQSRPMCLHALSHHFSLPEELTAGVGAGTWCDTGRVIDQQGKASQAIGTTVRPCGRANPVWKV